MRIFVADADANVRLSVQMMANQHPDLNVIGIAVHAKTLVEQVAASNPDLLFVNWDIPGQSVVRGMAQLRACIPELKIVVLCVRPEAKTAALAAGADAFVDMNTPSDELVNILRTTNSHPLRKYDSGR